MRSPWDNVDDIASNIVFTASSASFGASWLWRDAKISINSDLVMDFKRQIHFSFIYVTAEKTRQEIVRRGWTLAPPSRTEPIVQT
jgi:hypothetical protein